MELQTASRRLGLRSQRGQALAEFALASLVLMVLVLGIVDLSRAVYVRSMVASAAREAARVGSVDPGNAAAMVQAARERIVLVGINPSDPNAFSVAVSRPDGEHVQVDVACRFVPVTLFIAQLFDEGPAGVTLRARSIMRIEP